jgi:hypothetical protein
MKCLECKKEMSIFEPSGLLPVYGEKYCVKCSEQLLIGLKPRRNPLMKKLSKTN